MMLHRTFDVGRAAVAPPATSTAPSISSYTKVLMPWFFFLPFSEGRVHNRMPSFQPIRSRKFFDDDGWVDFRTVYPAISIVAVIWSRAWARQGRRRLYGAEKILYTIPSR
jgi:hypothetical protein